ncbi:alpha/beta hydrolase [Phytomonospora sp. NPDC050363]|uniref:alpha/beta hydrolase n=1 Tax=Phytomonospora sp. NPDC050363 TaxID=3155642 RepID=UPI0033FA1DAB
MSTWRERLEANLRLTVLLVLAAVSVATIPGLVYPIDSASPVGADPADDVAGSPFDTVPRDLIDMLLPSTVGALEPVEASYAVAADPELSVAAVERDPASLPDDPFATAISLLSHADTEASSVRRFFSAISAEVADWAAVLFPDSIGNLDGAPYSSRIAANRIRVTAESNVSTRLPVPVWAPPSELAALPYRDFFTAANARGHDLIYFDPGANNGQGSWVELIGDLDTADRVGIMVPGGSASVVSDNFVRYALRAKSFVDAPEAGEKLAVIVWAGAEFPSGWAQEGMATYAQRAAPRLAAFSEDLRTRLAPSTTVVAVGHSYGGPVVGLAETEGLSADVVLHLASAGSGHGVSGPEQLDDPCRPRYSMTAPADLIGYVQGSGDALGIGHGLDPDLMPGTILLDSGFHLDDPNAVDDIGRPLGPLAGTEIRGIHAHSEIFNPGSGGWRNVLAVLTGGSVVLEAGAQPPVVPGCAP